MASRARWGLSASQKKELWERWKAGESLSDIARVLEKRTGSIHAVLKATGGIAPRERCRPRWALSLAEREEISRGLAAGDSVRAVAARLGRSPSTVSREINRHGGRMNYRALKADERAWRRARRPKRCLLAANSRLRDVVAEKLKEDFSPQQIRGWLAKRYPDDEVMRVSAETIYLTLFIQARGALKRELLAHLRSRRTMRYARRSSTLSNKRGQIKDAVSIRERPPEAEDRAVPGHWEGDLLAGSRGTHVATLVERSSRFVMLVRVRDKSTVSVVEALGNQVRELPKRMMDTLTWDRGMEMADHKKFTIATNVKVYFCDPSSPWQRGTNENTNRLLRQYLPKGTDLSVHSQQDLDAMALRLNTRPRKTLDYSTPADTLARTVALTG
ncbi:MAG: IS30 family transposase [Rubrobacteraceae bacterium]